MISPDLSRRLTAAARRQSRARSERDDLIRLAHAEGGSLREIARLVGMEHTAILRIVRKEQG